MSMYPHELASQPPLPLSHSHSNNNNNTAPERAVDDKKKEALSFLQFYFTINPQLSLSHLRRSTILALYTNKVHPDSRYKKPNDMANLCGVIYGHIYTSLSEEHRHAFIKCVDIDRQSAQKDGKKRRRKSKADSLPMPSSEIGSQHDLFISCLKFSQFVPFLELNSPEVLDPSHERAKMHADWVYTLDNLARWESDLKEIRFHSKLLGDNLAGTCHFGRLDPRMRVDVPVNLFETPDSFIIYAFIPFHKPNAMKVTVNQMEVVLEGVVSLPQSYTTAPTGEEISLPEGLMCTKMEIMEGSFYKLVKLSSPVASSVVGKRDGVIVIHARKEESQSTIHQL